MLSEHRTRVRHIAYICFTGLGLVILVLIAATWKPSESQNKPRGAKPMEGSETAGRGPEVADTAEETVYNYTVKDIHGADVPMSTYKGKVLLIVNVASKCGLAKNSYTDLGRLIDTHYDSGLRVLLFPCSQFLKQEHADTDKIKEFAAQYSNKFDLFGPISVNGSHTDPLFKFLKKAQQGTLFNAIKWNFTYFLVDRRGVPRKRYSPSSRVSPDDPTICTCLNEE